MHEIVINLKFVASCEAPNGKGPQKIIEDIMHLIPLNQIKQRYALYAYYDEQMQQFIALLSKPSFKAFMVNLKNSDAYERLRIYACSQLYLDIEYYSKILQKIYSFGIELPAGAVSGDFKERSGVQGFLEDVDDLLPKKQIRIVMENAYDTDPIISKFVERLKSVDFKLLLNKIKNSTEYVIVGQALKDLGIEKEVLNEVVGILLGFQGLQ